MALVFTSNQHNQSAGRFRLEIDLEACFNFQSPANLKRYRYAATRRHRCRVKFELRKSASSVSLSYSNQVSWPANVGHPGDAAKVVDSSSLSASV